MSPISSQSSSPCPKYPNNIGKVIKRHHWKLDEVASQTGIPRRTLIDYSQGRTAVPRERLLALSQCLSYPTSYLVPPFPEVYLFHSQDEQAKDAQALLALQTHWQKHPTDENALRELMVLLGMHRRYDDIEQCYAKFLKELEQFTRRGPEPSTSALLEEFHAQKALHDSSLAPENVGQASQTKKASSTETATNSQEVSAFSESGGPLSSISSAPIYAGVTLETLLWLLVTHPTQFQAFVQQLQNEPPTVVESAPDLVDASPRKEEAPPTSDASNQDIMKENQDSGGEGMYKDRRKTTHGIVWAGVSVLIGHQDLVAEVQRVLHQPSLSPGDKELKGLEQNIKDYWLDYYGVTVAPADLMLHVAIYVQDVKTLLGHSLLPSTRTRLCACLSQGMLLIGVNCYATGQFQTARMYFQAALEAAHEADNNILKAETWCWDSYSWMRSNEPNHYQHALNSMLKACGFASLGSDLTVQSHTLAGSAEVYGYLKNKAACIQALKDATKLGGYGRGGYHHIHQFDGADLHWYRGISLQQFGQPGDPDSHTLLEEAEQAMQEALSQLGAASLQRAFYTVDMAQLQARKGEIESACDHARQIITFAGANASVRHKLSTVRTLLEPYADVVCVKGLDREIRVVLLAGRQPS